MDAPLAGSRREDGSIELTYSSDDHEYMPMERNTRVEGIEAVLAGERGHAWAQLTG